MRYHHKSTKIKEHPGFVYRCNHLVYRRAMLFKSEDGRGLCIIQQHFNRADATTYWTEIDYSLAGDIYNNPRFQHYFEVMAKEPVNGIYPAVPVRKAMWALKMKPLRKEKWETTFDRTMV